jgi:hypothetical protein
MTSIATAATIQKIGRHKYREEEITIEDAVSEGWGIIEELAQEMRDAADNTPESLQQGGVGAMRVEAADALENISEPEVPDSLKEIKIKVMRRVRTPKQQMKMGRRTRLDEAVNVLSAAVSHLEDMGDDTAEAVKDDADQFAQDVQAMIDEADGVEFPGMYG